MVLAKTPRSCTSRPGYARRRRLAIAVDDADVTKQWDAKIFDADFAVGAKTYTVIDPEQQKTSPEPVDQEAPAIEQTDESDDNPETGPALNGPGTKSAEDTLASD